MFYNVMKAKDIIDVENDKFIRKPLMENNESSFNIVTIKKGAIIDTHTSKADAAVYVIDGEIELHFGFRAFFNFSTLFSTSRVQKLLKSCLYRNLWLSSTANSSQRLLNSFSAWPLTQW